jgi:hypothetical protein
MSSSLFFPFSQAVFTLSPGPFETPLSLGRPILLGARRCGILLLAFPIYTANSPPCMLTRILSPTLGCLLRMHEGYHAEASRIDYR